MLLEMQEVSVAQRLLPCSARIQPGEQVHLIGPNGSGKSSLLARLSGLLPGGGVVKLAGRPLTEYSGRTLAQARAYLCQQQPASAMLSVFQYLSLHQPPGSDAAAVAHTIAFLAGELALRDKLARMLTRLSGGEWQRVRLAAVFLQVWPTVNAQSRLLLLDEPATGLDIAQRLALNALIAEFCATGRGVILSAHDLNQTLRQADRVLLLQAGQLVAEGKPQDVMIPARLSPVFQVSFYRQRLEGGNELLMEARQMDRATLAE